MRIAVTHELPLDFWGASTRVLVQTAADHEHLSSYFRSFAHGGSDWSREIALVTEPQGAGFVASALDAAVEKVVLTRDGGGSWDVYDRFTARSNRRSPLPPFDVPALRERLAVLHGAALVTPTGRGVVLCGGSLAGKSTVTLALLERGWGMLSDDLTVLRVGDGHALRFDRPIGVRANTFRLLPGLSERLARVTGPLVAAEVWTGTTVTAHVADLYPERPAPPAAPVEAVYVLEPPEAGEPLAIEPVEGPGAAAAIDRHAPLGTHDWQEIAATARFASYRTTFAVERDLAALVDALEARER